MVVKLNKIVIATRNPAKKARFSRLLEKIAQQVLGLDDLGVTGRPFETGETAEANAEVKARYYSQATGLPVLCEDESLFVDFLPESKQPGVHVRRVNRREEVDDDKLLKHWEKIVASVPFHNRTGQWHIAYCLATTDGRIHTASLDHPIHFFSPSSNIRKPGWPMSSLQGPARFGKPETELTVEEERLLRQGADSLILEKITELFGNSS
jgi:inosine/xanthosine triphosphate pyrophosphatase family protein